MRKNEPLEKEGFHNQTITKAGAQRAQKPAGKPARKVVALQLDAREQAALSWLGGPTALKSLLAPQDLCIRCRRQPPESGTPWDSLCLACAQEEQP